MTIEENDKGFKVIKMNVLEARSLFGGLGVCDSCNKVSFTGYYIAVMNSWYCPECYEDWLKRAKRYDEDIPIEERNFECVKRLME